MMVSAELTNLMPKWPCIESRNDQVPIWLVPPVVAYSNVSTPLPFPLALSQAR